MTATERPLPQPVTAFQAALPVLARLNEELSKALGPAMNADYEHRDRHGVGDGYTACAWHLSKVMRFLLEAARAAEAGDRSELHEALREVDTGAARVAGYARDVRAAAAADARELAVLDEKDRTVRAELGDTVVEQLSATVSADDGEHPAAADQLTIGFYDHDARPSAMWRGNVGQLALDGRTHLDLVAVGQLLGVAYDRYLHGTAFHDELSPGPLA